VRTVFNLLGPLTNPAVAPNQVIGVFSAEWLKPLAQVLARLGSRHVMVIHAEDGLDEISIAAPTHVAELIQGTVKTYRISPVDFGLRTSDLFTLKVDTAEQSLAIIEEVLSGRDKGPARDIVCLNAGAAIYVAGLADDLHSGVNQARDLISKGEGERKLAALVRYTHAI
jgi:anthranilate phosphoribosyltransferase